MINFLIRKLSSLKKSKLVFGIHFMGLVKECCQNQFDKYLCIMEEILKRNNYKKI